MKYLLIAFVLSFSSIATEKESRSWNDLKDTAKYFAFGGVEQFKTENNFYYFIPAFTTTYYTFQEDRRLSDHERSKKLRKIYDVTGDLGIVFNFPLFGLGTYYYGRNTNNNHAIQFAKEYMAAMYLTLFESGVISYTPGHERPNSEGQSVWETAFRGDNSFPSGHIIPYSVLFFKTLQFYGPYWAVIPGVLTYFSAMQRVREGRHYVSDVVGSFWLSAFASEGVRQYAKYKKNHPFYRAIFERRLELNAVVYRGVVGPGFTFRY